MFPNPEMYPCKISILTFSRIPPPVLHHASALCRVRLHAHLPLHHPPRPLEPARGGADGGGVGGAGAPRRQRQRGRGLLPRPRLGAGRTGGRGRQAPGGAQPRGQLSVTSSVSAAKKRHFFELIVYLRITQKLSDSEAYLSRSVGKSACFFRQRRIAYYCYSMCKELFFTAYLRRISEIHRNLQYSLHIFGEPLPLG